MLVPRFINAWVPESIICTQVNHSTTSFQQLRDGLHTRRVRQTAEGNVTSFPDLLRREVFASQIEEARERRVDFAQKGFVLLASRRSNNFRVRMSREDLQKFESRVAGCTKNRDSSHLGRRSGKRDLGGVENLRGSGV
jgi:hypothetical protein